MKWVQYNKKIRKSIVTGDLYFTKSTALISRVIRLFTRSKVSHVGMFIWIENRLFCIESTAVHGCRMLLASSRMTEKFILEHTHIKVSDSLLTRLLNDVGRVKYNYLGVVLALFIHTHYQSQFCSEWIANKLHLNFSTLSRGVEPQDILEYFTN